MAIERVVTPYELLVRWCPETGVLKGAHVQEIERLVEDGTTTLAAQTLPARPLHLAGGDFPLADVLTQAQVDALSAAAQAIAERDTALAERDAAVAALAAAQGG